MCLQKVLVIIILVEVSFFLPLLAFCLLGWCKVGKCVVDVKKYERHLLKCEIQIRKWVESKFHEFWWMWKVVKCERWCGAQRKPDEVCQGRRQRCERRTAEVCPWFLSGILRPFCWSSQSFWGVGGEDWRVGSKIVLVFTFIRVLDVLEIDVVHGDWKLGFHSFLKLKKFLFTCLDISLRWTTDKLTSGGKISCSLLMWRYLLIAILSKQGVTMKALLLVCSTQTFIFVSFPRPNAKTVPRNK